MKRIIADLEETVDRSEVTNIINQSTNALQHSMQSFDKHLSEQETSLSSLSQECKELFRRSELQLSKGMELLTKKMTKIGESLSSSQQAQTILLCEDAINSLKQKGPFSTFDDVTTQILQMKQIFNETIEQSRQVK